MSCRGTLYTVRRGDTLWRIARREGISLQRLVAANPQLRDPDRIRPGDVLCIPDSEEEEVSAPDQEEVLPARGWCCTVLLRRRRQVPEPSVALARLGRRGHVVIGLHDMPPPSTFGSRWRVYKGWVVSADDVVEAGVVLHQVQTIFWIGHADVPDLSPTDQVVVTPEERADVAVPAGPVIYRGSLAHCS
ncbi:MAG: LysM peptidoglycan-binding domain-containing protein [Clostridia bacterium]|nr:LysM peptidoglycan-binding domain-containing protein [Clostridia bacterium]